MIRISRKLFFFRSELITSHDCRELSQQKSALFVHNAQSYIVVSSSATASVWAICSSHCLKHGMILLEDYMCRVAGR
jgi:hypothetical protein